MVGRKTGLHPFLPTDGFRRGKSCINNVPILKGFIEDAFLRNLKVGAIFIDIKGAFDHVNPIKLKAILRELNVPRQILDFVYFLLTKREVSGYHRDHLMGKRRCSIGVPQGSVMSPLLFNIYISNIHKNLDSDVRILAYADDIVIFHKDIHAQYIAKKLNKNLAIISHNLNSLDLTISPNKTKFVIFS